MINLGYAMHLEDKTSLEATAKKPDDDFIVGSRDVKIADECDPHIWHKTEDQGTLGSCEGHGLSSVMEGCNFLKNINDLNNAKSFQLSALFAYYASQFKCHLQGEDRGATIWSGVQVAEEIGVCKNELMPYPNPPYYNWRLPNEALKDATNYKIGYHQKMNNYEDIFNFISLNQGFVIIGVVFNRYIANPVNGYIFDFEPENGPGHCMCFLGYANEKDDQGNKFIWLANSYGVNGYGINGYAKVSSKAINKLLLHKFTVMYGLSDLSVPTHREIDYSLF
jgi:hypothetical protein